ncbi:hypothetical protein Acr_00g0070200 [Actinidia rufa]|uniref:Uncharacterized protein n=1 Tax=Actinidia rufa TaxID=165716 RepID=A0A7J0DR70_9ERIC|nr:hypothetical protein Acr_00g0070200 [Actinidia rufa]
MEKSNLFAVGIPRDDFEIIKTISGFSKGRFPFRYLGLLVAFTKLTIAQFHPFTDRIARHLNSWDGMNLSSAGRCELIRSILQGVECFWLATLSIPAGIREKLIRMEESGIGTINRWGCSESLELGLVQGAVDIEVEWARFVFAEVVGYLSWGGEDTCLE